MNEKQLEKLKKLQAKGKKYFLWYRGVFGWGLPVGILYSLLSTYIDFFPFEIRRFDLFVFLGYLAGLPLWLVMGYFLGEWEWESINRKLSQKR